MDQTTESLIDELKHVLSKNETDLWKIASGEGELRKKVDELKLKIAAKLKIDDETVDDVCAQRKRRCRGASKAVGTPNGALNIENDEVSRLFDKIYSGMDEYEIQLKKLIGNRIELRAYLEDLGVYCVSEQNTIHQETVEKIEFNVEYKIEEELLLEDMTNSNDSTDDKLSECVLEIGQAVSITNPKLFECYICKKMDFPSKDSIRRHMYKRHQLQHNTIPNSTTNSMYQCDECEKVFTQKGNLKFHLLQHFGHLPFSCEICGKQFRQSSALNYHMTMHTNEKPFPCHICSKRYRGRYGLKDHLKRHSNANILKKLCTICGKGFTSKSGYDRHMKAHIGLKNYACTLCPKRFLNAGTLNYHVKLHTGSIKKTVSCDVCHRAFIYQSQLRKHRVIHVEVKDRPHACNICEKRFALAATMRHHLLTHSGEKKHTCDICGRGFISPHEMVVHRRIHTGEYLFACP